MTLQLSLEDLVALGAIAGAVAGVVAGGVTRRLISPLVRRLNFLDDAMSAAWIEGSETLPSWGRSMKKRAPREWRHFVEQKNGDELK